MPKIFIIHGFEGRPNGGWRPWLLAELDQLELYACALAMPNAYNPNCEQWVAEITRHVLQNPDDEIYLVGHSLGVPAILRALESDAKPKIKGAVLIAGPCQPTQNPKIQSFLSEPFDFPHIRQACPQFAVIHGDNDPLVPLEHGRILSAALDSPLTIVPNGGHLNSASGHKTLPEALEALKRMILSYESQG